MSFFSTLRTASALLTVFALAQGCAPTPQSTCAERFQCQPNQTCSETAGCQDPSAETPKTTTPCQHACTIGQIRCMPDGTYQHCTTKLTPGSCRQWSTKTYTCENRMVCQNNACVMPCQKDFDCPTTGRCVQGLCETCPDHCMGSDKKCEERIIPCSPEQINCGETQRVCKETKYCIRDKCDTTPTP